MVHLSPVERPAVLVPTGFLRFTHPACPLPPGESEASISIPRLKFPQVHYQPPPDLVIYQGHLSLSTLPPFTAAPRATSCQSLLFVLFCSSLEDTWHSCFQKVSFFKSRQEPSDFKQPLCATQRSSPRL